MKQGAARPGLGKRLDVAIGHNPEIELTPEDAQKHPGYTSEYLETLGLTASDLLRLERTGRAVRGYTQNFRMDSKAIYRGNGSRKRWLILKNST